MALFFVRVVKDIGSLLVHADASDTNTKEGKCGQKDYQTVKTCHTVSIPSRLRF